MSGGEFAPSWRRYWQLLFRSPEEKSAHELVSFGDCTVEKIDDFNVLGGKKGALLAWPWLTKRKFQMIVKIQHGEYQEGGCVQIIREKGSFRRGPFEPEILDYRYWARPMADRTELLTDAELALPKNGLIESLDPVFVLDLR